SVRLNPEVLDAVFKADAIVLGPGSLYTSILPNLLVPGLAGAVRRSRALKIYVCNIMTQPGETDAYRVSDHCLALREQCGEDLIDYVIANTESPSDALLAHYRSEGQDLVEVDKARTADVGPRLIRARVLDRSSGFIRHHPDRLARAVMRLIVL
ncbi:MAG: 2-phospho-L-lactate transferase CofD family protein, partial [candidate division FCPU426 bacterium]